MDTGPTPGGALQARDSYIDALRALAISEVLLNHVLAIGHAGGEAAAFGRAPLGVQVFFLLSGWLLGGQLIRSLRKKGTFSVPRFWIRRWIRTLPLYYAVLGLRVVALFVIGYEGHRLFTPGMLVFAQNYYANDVWSITWSLCVQEHFYVVLPVGLLLLNRWRRYAWPAAIFLVLLSPVLRGFAYRPWDGLSDYFRSIEAPTHLRLDALVLGVALAAMKEEGGRLWQWCVRHGKPLAVAGAAIIIIIGATPISYSDEGIQESAAACVLGILALSLGVAMLIPAGVGARKSAAQRKWHPTAAWLADHAYAIYLVHSMVFVGIRRVGDSLGLPTPVKLLVMLIATLALAAVMRALVEKPALAYRDTLISWMDRKRRPRSAQVAPLPVAVDPPAESDKNAAAR